ncbi:3-hydroxyacyl-CoA dehydrogenase NAD-binding domain-containing protein [Noviherbaspirillum sedimenti]|uniref:3-hydroxyacyl-CoA dehydrogenase n=1 Tax=Noviherbaspirillum sedimenti TaxID=2320865 RepID=A0A3A3G1Q1_9BURK|nr:3-hydroxyacyl-CoA dehydrogenase NAD-binding domain-containing protein [Noviherbaspirillum sedimenti]RJG01841.1 3-hydroxyacyl-CoA dehydrogenase [Noviherbaspirillum sedimenti]
MITTEINASIGHLIIDLPGRSMNVFTPALADEMGRQFERLVGDDAIKAIVISSAKSSFIAGADLEQMADLAGPDVSPADALQRISCYGNLFRRIETCGKPVVAAASGTALGAGLELMLACHYRIAADNSRAQFGLPEVKLGLLPGAGGTQRLPRIIGVARSIPLLTKGTALSAQDALSLGILDEIVPPDQLRKAAETAVSEGRVKASAPWDEKGFRLPGGDCYAPANANALVAANAATHASIRDNYPAPYAILRCIYEGARLPIGKALLIEQKHFVLLVQGSVAQNMIRTLFFAKQAASKLARRPAGIAKSQVGKVGVLGAGFMGAGIAQVSAAAGIDVVLLDRDLATAQRGYDNIAQALEIEVKKGRLAQAARDALLSRIGVADSYAAFGDCDLVVEAVLEDAALKASVTKATEAATSANAIFATNTSALPINELAASSIRPENFIGLHFFSPVSRMELVEVIVGKNTSAQTLARSLDYIQQIRKTPIVVNDGYGFYTSRCVDAYIREGIRLLADGVSAALIENGGVALGMPVGPLALADEVGIDVLYHIGHLFRAREAGAWADDRHVAQNRIVDLLKECKRLGRKSGHGFYLYPGDAPKRLDTGFVGHAREIDIAEVKERLLYAQVIEAARCWADGVVVDAAEADLGAQLAWAFPSWLGGPFSFIDGIGAQAFVKQCDQFVALYGPRFEVPQLLREFETKGGRFYTDGVPVQSPLRGAAA